MENHRVLESKVAKTHRFVQHYCDDERSCGRKSVAEAGTTPTPRPTAFNGASSLAQSRRRLRGQKTPSTMPQDRGQGGEADQHYLARVLGPPGVQGPVGEDPAAAQDRRGLLAMPELSPVFPQTLPLVITREPLNRSSPHVGRGTAYRGNLRAFHGGR